MRRLICTFVVRIWQKQVFSWCGSVVLTGSSILCSGTRHQIVKQGRNSTSLMPSFCSNFRKIWSHWMRLKKNKINIGNKDVNSPHTMPQEQPPKHLSLSSNSCVKIDVNVYNNITRNGINSWKVIQASSAHVTNHLWDGKTPNDQYPHGTWEQTSKTSLLAYLSHLVTKPTKWVCAQRRLRSVWASAQSDQSLRCPLEESLGP